MRHSLRLAPPAHRPLAQMRRIQGPNLVVLTRSAKSVVPSLESIEKYEDIEAGISELSNAGIKGVQRGMSPKSSLNLARVLSSLDWGKLGTCCHITLTYHRKWPTTKSDLAKAKQRFANALAEHCEAGIWRLEYQSRTKPKPHKVPHWHILAWLGNRDLAEFERWIRGWWSYTSGNPSEHGVKITLGDQARGTWYLAMHAAKREQSPAFTVGRWWGYISREKLLAAQDLHNTGVVSERERVWWSRLYRRSTGAKVRQGQGLSWFLPRSMQTVAGRWIFQQINDELDERHAPKAPF